MAQRPAQFLNLLPRNRGRALRDLVVATGAHTPRLGTSVGDAFTSFKNNYGSGTWPHNEGATQDLTDYFDIVRSSQYNNDVIRFGARLDVKELLRTVRKLPSDGTVLPSRTPAPVTIAPVTQAPTCENTCTYSNDGDCDDGGPNSVFSVCDYGTDCADCGDRGGLSG